MVSYLAGPEAAHVTGANPQIDGGYSARCGDRKSPIMKIAIILGACRRLGQAIAHPASSSVIGLSNSDAIDMTV